MQADQRYMLKALRLARRGLGRVEPNPMVGCVLVRREKVIGQGYHPRFGQAHAEVQALADTRRRGINPAGCDVYVTLEPCCHFGKTPPCADALIRSRVGRVIVAMVDPFPKVAGGGLARLEQAGIPVQVGLCQEQARQLIEPFIKRIEHGLPWVTAKWAQTLDGKIAASSGDSRWISNQASRKCVHQLRARMDAIVVGIGTVLADDPQLTARGVPLHRIARRVVIDPRLRIPLTSRLIRSLKNDVQAAPLLVATSQKWLAQHARKATTLRSAGVELLGLPEAGRSAAPVPERSTHKFGVGEKMPRSPVLDLRPLLQHLCQKHQATNVLLEGGCGLTSHFLRQKLVDQVLVFIAPKVLGDDRAIPALRLGAVTRMDQATIWSLSAMKRLGDDVLLDYRLAESHQA